MRFQGLDLNLLVALDAILAERGVTAASRKLNLSQSATSAALDRLREYFADPILDTSKRVAMLTPRALALADPVRDTLAQIRNSIIRPEAFDPALSDRHFIILLTDYAVDVVMRRALPIISERAPNMHFTLRSVSQETVAAFSLGEMDIRIGRIEESDLPRSVHLFDDDYVVLAAKDNPHTQNGLDWETYFSLGHVSVQFLSQPYMVFEEWVRTNERAMRKIEVSAPAFAALPGLILGSSRLATIHRKQAEIYAGLMPLSLFELPFHHPALPQHISWHRSRNGDAAVEWLISQLLESAGSPGHPSV